MASPIVDQTIVAITASTTVIDGAILFINSIPQMITEAVNKALNNGATATELTPLSDLATTLQAKSKALQDALVANTPDARP